MEYMVNANGSTQYKTLQEALLKIKMDEENLASGEEIKIMIDGFLPVFSKLRITNDTLPKGSHPIVIEGVSEKSGFNGGLKIEGMEQWKDNIWRINLPHVDYTRHLYIDGKFAKRPSTPYKKSVKWSPCESKHFDFLDMPNEICEDGYRSGIVTTYTDVADWKNISDVEMIFDVGWTHKIIPIEYAERLYNGKVFIKPDELSFKSATKVVPVTKVGSCPNCFENVFELLGKPLEWYFDRKEKMLYIGFGEGDSPKNHDIYLPLIEQLFEIYGELKNPVCNILFKNLTFKNTTWLWPSKYGFPEIQANQMQYPEICEIKECGYSILKEINLQIPYEADYKKVISAIRVLMARNISFEGCTFTNLGAGALMYEYGAQRNKIVGNKFYEIGASAISLGDFFLERAHHPENKEEIVGLIDVLNNHIRNSGRELFGSVAVIAGYVQNVNISHNYIHDVPYTAISIGWGWGNSDISTGPYRPTPWKEPSVCMRNKITYNYIHNAMSVLSDGGAIYTLGCMAGSVISGNYLHSSSGYEGEGYGKISVDGYGVEEVHDKESEKFFIHGAPGGIYLDEGTQGIDVSNNLIHDILVPIHYHNQIDGGYKTITYSGNLLNVKPESSEKAREIKDNSGLEPLYRGLIVVK